jgi:O-antigen ligase
MLVLCAAVARLFLGTGAWIWPAVAVPALAVALASTMSRNVYLGAISGIGSVLAVRRVKMLLVIPVVVALALLVGPVRQRALSVFNVNDESNRDRVQMWGIGGRIVRDHPAFGVGPNQVIAVYPKYRPADYLRSRPVNVHLHNVFIQIAAERGLLALGAWLVFIGTAAAGLLQQVRWGPSRALAGAGLAAIVAMLTAGLFEHNFGDSEFLMLFLGLITLPYAARLPGDSAGDVDEDDGPAADSRGPGGPEGPLGPQIPSGVPRPAGVPRRSAAAAAALDIDPHDEDRPWR